MTFPIDIHIGTLIIRSHPFFEILAFVVAYRYYAFLRSRTKTDPLSPHAEWWIVIGLAVGAFLGSRIIAALENPYLFLHPLTWMYYVGGQTIAGGIAGGIVGVEITKRILHVRRKTGDIFVYPLLLGIIIGRIGCLLTGVIDGTVGLPSNVLWAFNQGDGIPRHPTSLYEILFLVIAWIMLKAIQKRNVLKEGDVFSIFVVGYSTFRFFEEFIKPRTSLYMGLSSIQLVALLLVIYYFVQLYKHYEKQS